MENKKITKAQNDKTARENLIGMIKEGKFNEFLQIGNNSFGTDVANAEGNLIPVRIDVVVPKVENGVMIADLESEYLDDQEIKEQEKLAKDKAKEKKIARDKKTREKVKEEKGE